MTTATTSAVKEESPSATSNVEDPSVDATNIENNYNNSSSSDTKEKKEHAKQEEENI